MNFASDASENNKAVAIGMGSPGGRIQPFGSVGLSGFRISPFSTIGENF